MLLNNLQLLSPNILLLGQEQQYEKSYQKLGTVKLASGQLEGSDSENSVPSHFDWGRTDQKIITLPTANDLFVFLLARETDKKVVTYMGRNSTKDVHFKHMVIGEKIPC